MLWACLILLFIGLYLVAGPRLLLSQWSVTPQANAAMDEALAWKRGTFALAYNDYEVAWVDGKPYNVVGPAFTLISLVATTLTHWLGGGPEEFYAPWYVAVVALPIPLLAYAAFLRQTGSPPWAAVLTAYLIIATPLLPVLALCRTGSIYYINHALAVIGLLLLANDLLGAQRVWPALFGLALAAWSRQMTCFYAIPILAIAWRQGRAARPPQAEPGTNLRGGPARARFAIRLSLPAMLFIAAVPMTINALKFANPFDSGYTRMYAGRKDEITRRAQECFFGPRYVPMHARAMNLSFPRWDIRGGTLYPLCDNLDGASLWLTCPLLLGVFTTVRRWWIDPPRRALMVSTLPVITGLWCYHTTGSHDSGHYRYALDFIPLWLMVIAPYLQSPRGRPLTLLSLAYGALYFSIVP